MGVDQVIDWSRQARTLSSPLSLEKSVGGASDAADHGGIGGANEAERSAVSTAGES